MWNCATAGYSLQPSHRFSLLEPPLQIGFFLRLLRTCYSGLTDKFDNPELLSGRLALSFMGPTETVVVWTAREPFVALLPPPVVKLLDKLGWLVYPTLYRIEVAVGTVARELVRLEPLAVALTVPIGAATGDWPGMMIGPSKTIPFCARPTTWAPS